MPSNWAPSLRVVSKMSTAVGMSLGTRSSGMFDPVLVLVDLAAHGPAVLLADGQRHRARGGDGAVVDRGHRGHLGRGAAHEHLLGHVQVAAGEVAQRTAQAE